jgi:crossover junction endodeoxyribonuclease RuvC
LDLETLAYAALAKVEPRLFGMGATPLNPAQTNPIRILGIDPGLRITGFGVIEKMGNKLAYLASGCIKTDAKTSLPTRLGTIYCGLRELVAQYQPDQAVIEIVFVNVNPQSTLLLGQARGAAITALVAGGVEVAEYTALQVKQAVVGNGHADKKQVQHMVRRLLSLPGDPSADAADALACAIAHAHGGQGLGALATKGFRVRNGRMIEGN